MDINTKIPEEKFQFAEKRDITHDKHLETKPIGYFHDAFNRFCKNKSSIFGAIVIIFLVLYAIVGPIVSSYTVSYKDSYFTCTLPKCSLFANTNFWDGCQAKEISEYNFTYYYAMGMETGHNAIKNQEYAAVESDSSKLYDIRLDSYQSVGMIYMLVTTTEYQSIQDYQDETGIQVIYPTIALSDRPSATQNSNDANYYFKTSGTTTTKIVYEDENDPTSIIPVYQQYASAYYLTYSPDGYTSSMRIEGADGFEEDGTTYYYSYARNVQGDYYEIRINYYEYYVYYHTTVACDGIAEPSFLFGTTGTGQDVFTALAAGARFSLIFSTLVALVNLAVGAVYGSVEGYYGGKVDMTMERISDILSAIPFTVVVTLLKLHMGSSSSMLILFISFFLTGWIGMASATRMQFYRFKNQEYVLAARTLGAKDGRIIRKHIFPNALGTLVTRCALIIPSMIYSEVSLSYLGILNLSTGNISSVGVLLSNGQSYLSTFPHIVLFPSLFLALLLLSFNLFGNGLRDAFNPTLRGSEG